MFTAGVTADLDPWSKSASRFGPGGPYPLADLDQGSISASGFGPGVQIRGGSKSAVTPAVNTFYLG